MPFTVTEEKWRGLEKGNLISARLVQKDLEKVTKNAAYLFQCARDVLTPEYSMPKSRNHTEDTLHVEAPESDDIYLLKWCKKLTVPHLL